jgi:hypothetical protein
MLLNEETIRLEEAAGIARSHFSTVYRWVLRGVPGPDGRRIKLEATRLGRAWVTSRQALARFAAALTPKLDDEPLAMPRSPQARRKASERAAKQLAKVGV